SRSSGEAETTILTPLSWAYCAASSFTTGLAFRIQPDQTRFSSLVVAFAGAAAAGTTPVAAGAAVVASLLPAGAGAGPGGDPHAASRPPDPAPATPRNTVRRPTRVVHQCAAIPSSFGTPTRAGRTPARSRP